MKDQYFNLNELHSVIFATLYSMIPNNDFTLDSDLKEELDSLDIIEFTMHLEKHFSISITEDQLIELDKIKVIKIKDILLFLDEYHGVHDNKRNEKIMKIIQLIKNKYKNVNRT